MIINDALKKQIHSSTDDKLLEMLNEKRQDYTESAIETVKEEVMRRGGEDAIRKQNYLSHENKKEQQDSAKLSYSPLFLNTILHFLSSLMPVKARFHKYPSIYFVSKTLKVLALSIAIIGIITMITALVNFLMGDFGLGMVMSSIFLKQIAVLMTLWVISEVLQVLVDIERNTRKNIAQS